MSGLDDLIKKSGTGGGAGGLDNLLSGLGGGRGGGLGSVIGGILGGGSGGGAGSALGNPMVRMLLPAVASLLANGGLSKVLSGLQSKGKSSQVESWLAKGDNHPVAGEDVRAAVGDQEIAKVAAKLGITETEAAEAVAKVLPEVVDQVSPNGELKNDDELESALDRLKKLAP